MTVSNERRELGERLRYLIGHTFPTAGRFQALEVASSIKASKWKNFYYRKQEASSEMVEFWCKKYPNDEKLLRTGEMHPPGSTFMVGAPVPINWTGQTVGDRLVWVITEWASAKADQVFSYLEQRSRGAIPASEWASVVMRMREPTVEMIEVVCNARPHFTEWVITGRTCGLPSVDPTSEKSVAEYKHATFPATAPN
ncbi:hypothetical protein [Paraburkholderia agricolaris]|uniref:hypothetical protein n=1 Tax=Paraburkholderia agricolaris TaxID=2152888 RepID=UPI001291050A|nr:hypothetical protein [Paraburkholderia agricolaris]